MIRAQRIRKDLAQLKPLCLELDNESDSHAGPPGRETHFKLLLVSAAFEGLGRVERQRKVYDLLMDELSTGLHALTMRLLTPSEWEGQKNQQNFQSPACTSARKS